MKKHLTTKIVLFVLIVSFVVPAAVYAITSYKSTSDWRLAGSIGGSGKYGWIRSSVVLSENADGTANVISTGESYSSWSSNPRYRESKRAPITVIGARADVLYKPVNSDSWQVIDSTGWNYERASYYPHQARTRIDVSSLSGEFKTRTYGYFRNGKNTPLTGKYIDSPAIEYKVYKAF